MADSELRALLDRLSAQQAQIAAARPLPPATLRSLLDDFLIRYAHETTALEGNTLTLHETQVVLEQGITVAGKTLREHLEVVNVRDAWEWLNGLVQESRPITEEAILKLHEVLMKGILADEAGTYRRVPVFIRGSRHVPPNWVKVPDLMAAFAARLQAGPGDKHPIRFAAEAHIELGAVHPFTDGNGRVCRMLVNLLLLRGGYPPALYTQTSRAAYLKALEAAQVEGQPDPFVRITAEATEFMLDRYVLALYQIRDAESGPDGQGGLARGGR
ncbi:MAG: Fic family protein [Symbiobacteriia bacterium]